MDLTKILASIKSAEPALRWIAIIAIAVGLETGVFTKQEVADWAARYAVGLGQQEASLRQMVAPATLAPSTSAPSSTPAQ